jgi:hypothetical protein
MLLDTNNLDPLLSGLTHSEIEELVLRYCFSDDSATELVNRYGLNCEPRKLLKALPVVITNLNCAYCQQKMVRKIRSKTSKQKPSEPFCQNCKHSQSSHCSCFHCKKHEFFQQNTSSLKDEIIKCLEAQNITQPLHFTDLSLKDALYLITLMRSSLIVSEGHIGPFTHVPPLSPHDESIIFNHLMDRELITLSANSADSAFIVIDNIFQNVDLMAATWNVHLENAEETLIRLNNIIESEAWPPAWRHQIKAVWLEIALLECSEFLEFLADERKFELNMTDELKNNLLALLRHYSVSHCFSMMRDAVREVSDNIVKETLSRSDAGNHILQYCFQAIKKTNVNTEETRPYTIPQSQLSYVFHYEFLNTGEAGFSAVPHGID